MQSNNYELYTNGQIRSNLEIRWYYLMDREAYSEPFQTYKMELFIKIVYC